MCDACEQLNLEAEVTHLYEMKEYAKYGVMLTPCVIVDNKAVSSGRVPSVEDLKKILETEMEI